MRRFKNILYVADQPGTESPSFLRALELAQSNHARLTVMDVVEPVDWSAENEARYGTDLTAVLYDRRLSELRSMTAPCYREGIVTQTKVAVGTPFLEVIRAVVRNDFDLVIKNAEAARGFAQKPFGPNDQHLIRKCPCPVWIDRPDRPRPYRRILAAVDPLSDAGAGLDRLIMDLAASFVAWEDAEVHVAHGWWLPGESVLRGARANVSERQLADLLETKRAHHANALRALLAHYDLSLDSPNVHFYKSAPTPLIADTAQKLPADLIVMGTAGRTGIPGFFIGNTAESILLSTDTPVLTIKPAGFESPVVAS